MNNSVLHLFCDARASLAIIYMIGPTGRTYNTKTASENFGANFFEEIARLLPSQHALHFFSDRAAGERMQGLTSLIGLYELTVPSSTCSPHPTIKGELKVDVSKITVRDIKNVRVIVPRTYQPQMIENPLIKNTEVSEKKPSPQQTL